MIPNLNLVILFAENPMKSGAFYNRIFDLKPIEEHPNFVMFALPNGVMLGFWSSKEAQPPVLAGAGSSEICFVQENVDEIYRQWVKLGVPMAQVPTDMDFGRTFVALDPDGHRIRIYRPV